MGRPDPTRSIRPMALMGRVLKWCRYPWVGPQNQWGPIGGPVCSLSTAYRAWITFQLRMLAMAVSLGSSIIAPAESTLENHFGVGHEVAVLCISLYM
jgi:hypothetical protein